MKKAYLILFGIFIFAVLGAVKLYSSPENNSGESIESTKTVSYNIEAYNKTGSFTVDLGSNKNSKTGKVSGFIRVHDENGNIIQEITPETLNKQIKKLEVIKSRLKGPNFKKAPLKNMAVSLQEFKQMLEDKEKFDVLAAKFRNMQTESGLPYSSVISTIRGQQETVSGSIE